MNEDVYGAVLGYTKWYTAGFGTAQPNWYVFLLASHVDSPGNSQFFRGLTQSHPRLSACNIAILRRDLCP